MRDVFRRQAEHFEALGSPVYARLAERLARRPVAGRADPRRRRRLGCAAPAVRSRPLARALGARARRAQRALGGLRRRARRARGRAPAPGRDPGCPDERGAALHGRSSRRSWQRPRETRPPARAPRARAERGPEPPRRSLPVPLRERHWGPEDAASSSSWTSEAGRVPAGLLARRARRADAGGDRPCARRRDDARRATCCSGASSGPVSTNASPASRPRSRRSGELPERPELIRGTTCDCCPRCSTSARPTRSPSSSRRSRPSSSPRRRRPSSRARSTTAGADGRPLAWVSVVHGGDEPSDGDFELELRIWPGPARLAAHIDPHGNWLDWRLP